MFNRLYKIFIGGIPIKTTESMFYLRQDRCTSTSKNMESCLIWLLLRIKQAVGMDSLDKPRGFGFVTYKDELCFNRCLGVSHELNGKIVSFSYLARLEARLT